MGLDPAKHPTHTSPASRGLSASRNHSSNGIPDWRANPLRSHAGGAAAEASCQTNIPPSSVSPCLRGSIPPRSAYSLTTASAARCGTVRTAVAGAWPA